MASPAFPDYPFQPRRLEVRPGPTRGTLVSLRLDMATYFRRAATSAAEAQ